MADEESLETPGSNPEGDTGAPGPHSEFGAIRGRCPPTVVIATHPHLPHPTHPAWLTLQLLVPSLPLQAYRGCPVMDEALEAGILALLHGAAGWLNRDDRAPKAWGTRRQGLGSAGLGRLDPLPQPRSPPPSLLMASATLTVGRPRTGGHSDREGGFPLRACTANHAAHILARIGGGDVVEPQPRAMGLSAEREGSQSGQSTWTRQVPTPGCASPGILSRASSSGLQLCG